MCQSHDNLPGVSWQSSVDTSQIKSEHAVSAMIRLVNGNPGLYHLLSVHTVCICTVHTHNAHVLCLLTVHMYCVYTVYTCLSLIHI